MPQVVVQRDAAGESEQAMFIDALDGIEQSFATRGLSDATVLTDSGFHSEANVEHLFDRGIVDVLRQPRRTSPNRAAKLRLWTCVVVAQYRRHARPIRRRSS
jgi:hypothetical protein